jgi:hypothetical protein
MIVNFTTIIWQAINRNFSCYSTDNGGKHINTFNATLTGRFCLVTCPLKTSAFFIWYQGQLPMLVILFCRLIYMSKFFKLMVVGVLLSYFLTVEVVSRLYLLSEPLYYLFWNKAFFFFCYVQKWDQARAFFPWASKSRFMLCMMRQAGECIPLMVCVFP